MQYNNFNSIDYAAHTTNSSSHIHNSILATASQIKINMEPSTHIFQK